MEIWWLRVGMWGELFAVRKHNIAMLQNRSDAYTFGSPALYSLSVCQGIYTHTHVKKSDNIQCLTSHKKSASRTSFESHNTLPSMSMLVVALKTFGLEMMVSISMSVSLDSGIQRCIRFSSPLTTCLRYNLSHPPGQTHFVLVRFSFL
ncbi:hypothetical protein PoB_005080300 [Plakobranchus ocellatus]|uniref:Uncharacterized protein n=1 Tax=Plakobranchus ocellatus TaxID=259542 RepID=A0AAV4BZQ6_9GAST|nr:hypothetical protein PoB_005080300 [Plakobranchus ocellatus]